MEGDNSESNIPTSKYHSAKFILERINEIWKDARKYRESGRLIDWNWILDSAWLELCDDAKPEQKTEFKSFMSKITANKGDKEKLYQILMEKEELLRTMQKEQGKSNKYQDEDEDDFA